MDCVDSVFARRCNEREVAALAVGLLIEKRADIIRLRVGRTSRSFPLVIARVCVFWRIAGEENLDG